MLINFPEPLPPQVPGGLSEPAYAELVIATKSVIGTGTRGGRPKDRYQHELRWLAQESTTILREQLPRLKRGNVDLSPTQRDVLFFILAAAAVTTQTVSKPRQDALKELFAFAKRAGITDDSTPQKGEVV
jgi:hypothetical protein